MTGCGCTGFTHGPGCGQRPERPLMTGQPGAALNPDDLILADYDLHMGKEFRQPLTFPAPEQAAHVAGVRVQRGVERRDGWLAWPP